MMKWLKGFFKGAATPFLTTVSAVVIAFGPSRPVYKAADVFNEE